MIYVRLYSRKSRKGNFSIEGVFQSIQKALRDQVFFITDDKQKIVLSSMRASTDKIINHITGDIHYKALALSSKNTILTVHDIGHYEKTLKGIRKLVYKWVWLKWPLRRVKYVTCVSEFTKQCIISHFKIRPEKIHVIYNPVPDYFTFSAWPNNQIPILLQVGTGDHKNLQTVIKAIEGLNVKLHIVGILSEDQISSLQQSRIAYTNFYDLTKAEMVRLYHQADIVTFVSLYEGFGLPVIESQACGRPVIISSCASLPEVAGPGACMITDPFNSDSLREKLQNILKNKDYRDQVIRDGLENTKRFSPKVIACQYLALYNSI